MFSAFCKWVRMTVDWGKGESATRVVVVRNRKLVYNGLLKDMPEEFRDDYAKMQADAASLLHDASRMIEEAQELTDQHLR